MAFIAVAKHVDRAAVETDCFADGQAVMLPLAAALVPFEYPRHAVMA